MSGGECGDINKHIGKHRVCLLNMYVSFLVLSFSFLFFVEGVCAAMVLHLAASGPV